MTIINENEQGREKERGRRGEGRGVEEGGRGEGERVRFWRNNSSF